MTDHIALVSGGKDSTAMLILLAEKGTRLDYVVFNNTGIEFPETVYFVRKELNAFVKEHFGIEITEIHPEKSFGEYVQQYGVPHVPYGRWCCRVLKEEPFRKWLAERFAGQEVMLYYGYSADEPQRVKSAKEKELPKKYKVKAQIETPLYDAGIGEEDALRLCKDYGLLNPVYEKGFKRTGCYLCPFQPLRSWRLLWSEYPQLWRTATTLEKYSIQKKQRGFFIGRTLKDLEKKFKDQKGGA